MQHDDHQYIFPCGHRHSDPVTGLCSNSETWLPWPVCSSDLSSSGSQRILFTLNNAVISICTEITGHCDSLSISLLCSPWMLIKPLHLCHFHSSIQSRFLVLLGPLLSCLCPSQDRAINFCVSSPNAVVYLNSQEEGQKCFVKFKWNLFRDRLTVNSSIGYKSTIISALKRISSL